MNSYSVRATLAMAVLALPLPALAQRASSGVARITPYVGLVSFGSIADGPLGTRVSSQPAMLYGAQVGVNLTPNVALVGNVGYASSSVEVGLPIIGGLRIGDSKALLYDGGVQLRLPGISTMGNVVSAAPRTAAHSTARECGATISPTYATG